MYQWMNQKSKITSLSVGTENQKRGFTLIEMLVATALFSFVMILAVSSLLAVIDGNRKAQALKLAINNVNFALEGMSRTIRIGTNYRCSPGSPSTPPPSSQIGIPRNCGFGGEGLLAFEPFEGNPTDPDDQIVYRYIVDPAPNSPGRIERCTRNCYVNPPTGEYIPITAPEVNITEMTFYVTGAESSDNRQPRVIIIVAGEAGAKERVKTKFIIQTTVSQRILDL